MIILGVTGNSGSGKSAVCSILSDMGAFIIDADSISRQVLLKGEDAYVETLAFFGKSILFKDKEINRKKLGEIVFADEEKRLVLTEITHKYILVKIHAEIKKVEKQGIFKLCAIDAPLLIESGLDKICNKVWVVDALHATKISRIIHRDNISRSQAENRLASQTSSEKLRLSANAVILNNADKNALLAEVTKLTNALYKEYEA